MKSTFLVAVVLAFRALQAQTTEDVVYRAMHDELERSMKKLQLEALQRPYFISYRVVETRTQSASASFGSLTNSFEHSARFLSVSVRVGDYSLDSSNFFSIPFGNGGLGRSMFGGSAQLPIDNDYDELRRQIWLTTDAAYKKALEDLSGKRAALENKHRAENVPDFTKATPTSMVDMQPALEFNRPEAETMAPGNYPLFFARPPQFRPRRPRFLRNKSWNGLLTARELGSPGNGALYRCALRPKHKPKMVRR